MVEQSAGAERALRCQQAVGAMAVGARHRDQGRLPEPTTIDATTVETEVTTPGTAPAADVAGTLY